MAVAARRTTCVGARRSGCDDLAVEPDKQRVVIRTNVTKRTGPARLPIMTNMNNRLPIDTADGRTGVSRLGGSNRLISMREAADRINYSYVYFSQHFREWGIPSIRTGRKVQFRERDLEDFIETRRVT
jgi:excisionase family DNA binding protein